MTNHLRYETGELKACIDLRKVIEHFWGPGKPEGRAVRYAAHWRDDGRRDSFYVYDDGYKDFASGEAGDLLDWLQKEGIAPDFPSAAQWAINYLGGQVAPVDHPIIRSNRTSLQSTTPDWQQAALKALEESQRYLWSERREPKSILAYLQQERGLTEATIHQRSLGYNPSWHKTDYRNPDTGKLAKLPPGIVIPIWENGQLVALRVRCRVGTLAVWLDIDPDQFGSGRHEGEELPKYLNLAGSRLSGVLFNGDAVVSGQPVLLVEGEFDAMLADQILNANRDDPIAVVTLGSASNHATESQLTRLQQASGRFMIPDRDAAGWEAAKALFTALNSQLCLIHLSAAKDVTEFVVEQSGDLAALLTRHQAPGWWPSGVPDSWRTVLLNHTRPSTVLVIELIDEAMRAGLVRPDFTTIPQLVEASRTLGRPLSKRTIEMVIQEQEGLFLQKLESDSFSLDSNFCDNSRSGRPAVIYRIVSRQVFRQQLVDRAGKRIYEQLHPVIEAPVLARPTAAMMTSAGVSSAQAAQTAAELDQCYRPAYRRQNNRERFTAEQAARAWQQLVHSLDNLLSTPLPEDWPRHNAGLYQAAFFRALVFHAPKQSLTIRRQTICATLGAKKSSIHDLVRRAGLEAEPQTRTVPLQGHQDIRQEVSQTGRTIQGYPTCVVLQTADGTITIRRPYDAALSPKVIRQERAAGRVVSIVYQLASAYHIAREVFQPLPKKPVESSHSGGHAPRAPRKDSRPKPYYGPGYNPAWLVRQFEWAARLMGLYWEQGLVDPRTGEVVAFETLLNMLAVFLGHAVPTDASSDAADDDPAGTERSG